MQHVRGAPYQPQTQGRIERWHQTLKKRILLDNYYLPGDLERQARHARKPPLAASTAGRLNTNPGGAGLLSSQPPSQSQIICRR
jgi:hypothetical protein